MDTEEIRATYPEGTKIRLERMAGEDMFSMPPGLNGTVTYVDDIGQIHVSWENGSSLALNIEEDTFDVIDDDLIFPVSPEEDTPAEKITVLEIEPGKRPAKTEIYNDLESLQGAVSGLIEVVYPWDDGACIIVNEEGKIRGLPLNRALESEDGTVYDVIAGTMIIAGTSESSSDFISLTPEQIEKYTEKFKEPQTFLSVGEKIVPVSENDWLHVPVCYKTAERAEEDGEGGLYRLSFKANMACRKAIEKVLEKYTKKRPEEWNCTYWDKALDEVSADFGEERTKMVLANTCIEREWDARISRDNTEWAKNIELPGNNFKNGESSNTYFVCNTPFIPMVDDMCTLVRKREEESGIKRESVVDRLNRLRAEIKEMEAAKDPKKTVKKELGIEA